MGRLDEYRKLQRRHLARAERYLTRLSALYSKAVDGLVELASETRFDGGGQFYFSDFPELKKEVDRIVTELATGIERTVLRGTTSEWAHGNTDADGTVEYVLDKAGVRSVEDLTDKAVGKYFNNHESALKAFQKRKIGNGQTLSVKVWDLANHQKIEAELARSIAEGESAAKIASSMKSLLKEPDKLFRRVRDKNGVLRLSRNAKAYHPGVGTYRSSYRNALRLARTETNMAYRNAEWQSYQDKPYVVGIEIRRGTHPYDCPVCEALAGEYPKDFKWSGWHPNCRCYMIPILLAEDEMGRYGDAFAEGEDFDNTTSVNYVGDVPQGFREWIGANGDRIDASRSLPYFIKDNQTYVEKYRIVSNVGVKAETDMEKAERLESEYYREITGEVDNRDLADTMDITSDERTLLYSHDGYIGTGNSFSINTGLRNDNPLTEAQESTVKALDEVIDRNALPYNICLYRFVGKVDYAFGEELAGLMEQHLKNGSPFDFAKLRGIIIQDKGFTSTSLSTERNVFNSRKYCLEIKAQKGTKAYVTTNFGESEVVLKRGQKMVAVGGRKGNVKTLWGTLEDKIFIECVII